MRGSVGWISYTPIKGLRLRSFDSVDLGREGVRSDRRFHLINERGHLTNSTRVGALQQVEADWDEQAALLTLRFPDGSVVSDEIRGDGEVTTSFYGRPVEGHFVDGPFAAALSDFTGVSLRLIQPDRAGSGVDRGHKGAVTMLSEAALGPLAEAAGVDKLDGRRFRMLLGIAGVEAHAEDEWIGQRVRVGDAVVIPRGHVGRCLITSRDPETGEITADTLKALATYRRKIGTTEELPFGIYGEVAEPGTVRLGDPIEPE